MFMEQKQNKTHLNGAT